MPSANRTVTPFAEDIVRHEMCAFVPGYFQFIAETEVTVQSIIQFMRGMRVVVAVHPTDLYVYQRCVLARRVLCVCLACLCACVLAWLRARVCLLARLRASVRACLNDCLVAWLRACGRASNTNGGVVEAGGVVTAGGPGRMQGL